MTLRYGYLGLTKVSLETRKTSRRPRQDAQAAPWPQYGSMTSSDGHEDDLEATPGRPRGPCRI
eukprot:3606465-Pyramimonas_sp.AAC.1